MALAVIDFHSHMLPGIDDGSPNVETSIQMLHMAAEQGVQIQILTPHYYPWKEEIDSFRVRRRDSLSRLKGELTPELPKLLYGAEVAYFHHMSKQELTPLCISGTRILLIEMPFESWDSMVVDEIATLCLNQKFRVILAHVERFLSYRGNQELLDKLSDLPIYMQCNAEAFLEWGTRRKALELVSSGKVQLLGSDAHNLSNRKPNLAAGRQMVEKHLGAETLRQMDQAANTLLQKELVTQK